MAFSKIEINFFGQVNVGESIGFSIVSNKTLVVSETCFTVRTAPNQFGWDDAPLNNNAVAYNFIAAFNADYNSTELYTVTIAGNIVTIEATVENTTFASATTNTNVSFNITNEAAVTAFEIVDIVYATKAGSECTLSVCTVSCSSEVTDITSPVVVTGNTGNSISFDVTRGQEISIAVNNGTLFRNQLSNTPEILPTPTVDVFNSPSGASVNIVASIITTLNLTYSLDGTNYQNISKFDGITVGSYTAYLKDLYGCVKTVDFDVDTFSASAEITEPIIYISESNSFTFKKVEVWDNITIYKNPTNVLSCEETNKFVTKLTQKWQKNDTVTTTIKTSYDVAAKTVDWDENETALTVTKKTDNIGKKDMRDAIGYEFTDGTSRYGFYFMNGDTYDYDTEDVNGTYELYGEIPRWAKVGQYFSVDSGAYYKITAIEYVEAVNADVLIIDVDLAGNSVDVTVKTTYNLFNWDIYEFDVDMAALEEFYVMIDFTHADFTDEIHLSEFNKTYDLLDKMLYLESNNSKNNDVAYFTGIKHILRFDYVLFTMSNTNENDIHTTDNAVYQIDSYNNVKMKLVLARLTTAYARKLTKLFALDTIFINGIQYVTENLGSPEPSGMTNLYKMTIELLEKGEGVEQVNIETIPELDVLETPALVQGDSEFIKQ